MNLSARHEARMSRYYASVSRALRALRAKCPHCGNADPEQIETNGCEPSDSDFTLLCIARVKPGEDALADFEPHAEVGPDGMVACGMQWCPE